MRSTDILLFKRNQFPRQLKKEISKVNCFWTVARKHKTVVQKSKSQDCSNQTSIK
ncbi:hypothetical protein ZOSMA_10G01440 [Zostera marina]|uniref:Uncharacterized protein n=1 Tax=Zostera marina TaxID=29655 RepID=A0A0K9Q5S4_ZOSMR|nr:hypothetical protein ZOSMA_10G01440 [Zostera marina]